MGLVVFSLGFLEGVFIWLVVVVVLQVSRNLVSIGQGLWCRESFGFLVVFGGKINSLGKGRFFIFRFLENGYGGRSLSLGFLDWVEMLDYQCYFFIVFFIGLVWQVWSFFWCRQFWGSWCGFFVQMILFWNFRLFGRKMVSLFFLIGIGCSLMVF